MALSIRDGRDQFLSSKAVPTPIEIEIWDGIRGFRRTNGNICRAHRFKLTTGNVVVAEAGFS
jgi:hypothetical protein